MVEMNWSQWQQQVVSKIQHDYADILGHLTLDDVDWTVWRELYEQGRAATDAVDYAFVREPPLTASPILIDHQPIDSRAPVARTGVHSGR